MAFENPKISERGDRRLRELRHRVFVGKTLCRILRVKQPCQLLVFETSKAEIKVSSVQLLQFQSEKRLVPVRPSDRAVHHEAERFDLCRRPLVAEDHWDLGDAELACGLQA